MNSGSERRSHWQASAHRWWPASPHACPRTMTNAADSLLARQHGTEDKRIHRKLLLQNQKEVP